MQSRESIERRRNCSLSFSSYVSLLFSVCLVACEKEEKESEGSRGATSAECAESEREKSESKLWKSFTFRRGSEGRHSSDGEQ